MRRSLPVLFVLACVCCAKPPPPKPVEPKVLSPREGVDDLMQRLYGALEAHDADRVADLFEPDAMVFGLAPSETFNYRDKLMERVGQELSALGLSGDSIEFSEIDTRIGVAEGGRSAWFSDFPRATLVQAGKRSVWLPRLTGHAVKLGETWRFDALHVSLGVPDARTFAPDGPKKYLPPFEVAAERGRDSEQVVGLSKRMLEDIAVKVDRISDADEVVLLGTDPNDVYWPGRKFKELVKPRIAELKKGYLPVKVDGALRSRLAPGAKSGWVAANIVVRANTGKKVQTLPLFRALWIFAEEQEVWNLVSEHQSLAIRADQRETETEDELKARKVRQSEAPKPSAKSGRGSDTTSPPPAEGGKKPRPKDDDISTFE